MPLVIFFFYILNIEHFPVKSCPNSYYMFSRKDRSEAKMRR